MARKIAQYYNIQQVNRGIGGTRVTADTRTAWVTPNGEYLASEIQGDSEPTEEHITINYCTRIWVSSNSIKRANGSR